MKKILLTLLIISFSSIATAGKGATSVRLSLGYSDGLSFDSVEGDEFSTTLTNLGVYRAELSKSKSNAFYGLGINYSQTDNLDYNFGVSRYNHTFADQNVQLTEVATGNPNSHFFPEFDVRGYLFNLGLSYKFSKEEIEKVSYYAGIDALYFSGKMTNTNYNAASVIATGSFQGSDYGKGGTSNITLKGYMPKVGLIYPINKKVKIGAEYGAMKFYDIDGGAMRSFMNGFTGDSGSANRVMAFVDYKF